MRSDILELINDLWLADQLVLHHKILAIVEAFNALPWWQRLIQHTRGTWRLDCVWAMSRSIKALEEDATQRGLVPGSPLFGPGILGGARAVNWPDFLDYYTKGLIRSWASWSWWDRWRHALKVLTWLVYLQEERDACIRQDADNAETVKESD